MFEIVAFMSGALVMVLEMVGARVLAPHLGTSVVVWTSLIGVVLACLALGAWYGGRLADREASRRRLASILAGAGLGTVGTALLHGVVGESIVSHVQSLHMGAVLAAVVLFALPATLFGMGTPLVIRLCINDVATSGRTVGRINALSTAGSILGTFLGGFVLVSFFDSTHILLGAGAGMLLLSLLTWPRRIAARLSLLLMTGVAGWAVTSYASFMDGMGAPVVVETPYNHIRILDAHAQDGRIMRCLVTDPGRMQSAMYPDAPDELALSYTRFFALGPALVPDAGRVLMLGGGGYSIPRWLLSGQSGLDATRLTVDVVELDPGLTEVARQHFGLRDDDARLRIHHADARVFCNRNRERFDLVFVDVFGSHYSVPFHAGTQEAAAAMRAAVDDNGALLMNVIAAQEGEAGRLYQAVRGALESQFAEVHTFAVRDAADLATTQNLMLVAFPVPRPDLAPLVRQGLGSQGEVRRMLAARVTPPRDVNVLPLRDGYAPVERYAISLLKR